LILREQEQEWSANFIFSPALLQMAPAAGAAATTELGFPQLEQNFEFGSILLRSEDNRGPPKSYLFFCSGIIKQIEKTCNRNPV
jgi:hypothetical protein